MRLHDPLRGGGPKIVLDGPSRVGYTSDQAAWYAAGVVVVILWLAAVTYYTARGQCCAAVASDTGRVLHLGGCVTPVGR